MPEAVCSLVIGIANLEGVVLIGSKFQVTAQLIKSRDTEPGSGATHSGRGLQS